MKFRDTVEAARGFAIWAHGLNNQRYGTHPYQVHLDDVANILREEGFRDDSCMLAAAYLHDVLEDTAVPQGVLHELFGDEIFGIVLAVTNVPGPNRASRHKFTYRVIRDKGTRAMALKLADRIANVEHSRTYRSKHLHMYLNEHPEFRKALYLEGEHEHLWARLEKAFKP
jgi:(p)ppGpp synthase/HD superfamily hydrolase